MTTKITYANCRIAVFGMDMQCPLCQTVVVSGQGHVCSKIEDPKPAKRIDKPKARKRKA